jgi:hypothetical protein
MSPVCTKPPTSTGGFGRLAVVQVAPHACRAAHQQLSGSAGGHVQAGGRVDDLALDARQRRAEAAKAVLGVIGHRVAHAEFGHAVGLVDLAAQVLRARAGEVGAERGGAGSDQPQARGVVLIDGRMPG